MDENRASEGEALWYEGLYAGANRKSQEIPWARMEPHPRMVEWIADRPSITGKALVVGCGLGDDAEWLDDMGFDVTAFDVSNSSIDWCRERFPNSSVNYCVENLLSPPKQWLNSFDLIIEIHILQAIPEKIRDRAAEILPSLLNNNGQLLCIARLYDPNMGDNSSLPWALTRVWLEERFRQLENISFTYFKNNELPFIQRYIAVWKKS